jgi:hypothetical protein
MVSLTNPRKRKRERKREGGHIEKGHRGAERGGMILTRDHDPPTAGRSNAQEKIAPPTVVISPAVVLVTRDHRFLVIEDAIMSPIGRMTVLITRDLVPQSEQTRNIPVLITQDLVLQSEQTQPLQHFPVVETHVRVWETPLVRTN